MSTEERMSILNMLSEGKITVEEAERLLKAVSGEAAGYRSDPGQWNWRRRRGEDKASGSLLDDLGGEVDDALGSLRASGLGRVVRQEVSKAMGSLQKVDVGGVVGEIVEQVREAVGDVVARAQRPAREEEEEWSFASTVVESIHAEAVSGRLEISSLDSEGKEGEDERIHVHAHKRVHGRDEEAVRRFAGEMKLQAVTEDGVLRLYQEPAQPPRGVRARVHYRIRCPAKMAAELRLVNGNIDCEGLDGGADAQTVNGNVNLRRCAGRLRACTRNGNARAQVDQLRQECVLETTNGNVSAEVRAGQSQLTGISRNGSVSISLPARFHGAVDARTTNGTVTSDLPLASVSQQQRNLLVGQFGAEGGAQLRLHTRNGHVRLRPLSTQE